MDDVLSAGVLDFSPDVNFTRYLQAIRRYPILNQDEEFRLAMQYKKNRDVKAASVLINAHLRLVVKVVSNYRGYGLPLSEMVSEGNMGLLYAIEKFEPDRGFRFSTYALWWIKAYVQKYIISSWSLVKIGTTAAQKKLFFNLRKVKNKMNLNDDRDMSVEIIAEIARSLGVSSQEVKEMNMRLKSQDGSLNVSVDNDNDAGLEWIDFISDNKPNQEEIFGRAEVLSHRKKMFRESLSCLNQREKDILFKRRMVEKAMTLDDLSKAYNISKERVRQIELNSIRKIKHKLQLA